MSGKFMKVKKVVIPTLTLVIMCSQLMGCSVASKSELLQLINEGAVVEIEVAEPIEAEAEQGQERELTWEELAYLETNPTLRGQWDNILGIAPDNDGFKNGMFYVNADGEHISNNTLRVVLHNSAFTSLIKDTKTQTMQDLIKAVYSEYADIDADDDLEAFYVGINGYFNLLPDADTNYANPDSTITRLEYMTAVYRAETPVKDLTPDNTFSNAVGKNDYNIYAQGVASDSWLDIQSKSLNNLTANGNISRAEAVYLLVSRYFNNDLNSLDLKSATTKFTDVTNGEGNKDYQKIKSENKEKDYFKSYELTYVLQNPDIGMPEELYKAIIVAEQKGIISGNESRWDEAITRSEAIELIVNALLVEQGISTFNMKNAATTNQQVIEDKLTENTNEAGNGAGEQITTQEEDYFKEAEELWEQYSEQMDVNWETFRETYTIERKDNGLSQQQALDKLLDLFKKVVEQPKQQQSKGQTSSQSSTTNTNQSGSTPPPLTPEQQAIAEQMGGASFLGEPNHDGFTGIDYSGLDGINAE